MFADLVLWMLLCCALAVAEIAVIERSRRKRRAARAPVSEPEALSRRETLDLGLVWLNPETGLVEREEDPVPVTQDGPGRPPDPSDSSILARVADSPWPRSPIIQLGGFSPCPVPMPPRDLQFIASMYGAQKDPHLPDMLCLEGVSLTRSELAEVLSWLRRCA